MFAFLLYNKAMKNELLSTAYKELEKLKREPPNWDVYDRLNILSGAINLLENSIYISHTQIDKIIDEYVYNFGEKETIKKLKRLLNEIKRDIDCIAPSVGTGIVNKLRKEKD